MKEQLYTIPLNDAFAANDECPFCFIEQKLEQDLLDFTLGLVHGERYPRPDRQGGLLPLPFPENVPVWEYARKRLDSQDTLQKNE